MTEEKKVRGTLIKKVKKINGLFTKITIYLSISIAFLILFLLLLNFHSQQKTVLQQQLHVLENQNSAISAQINDIINQSISAKN